MIESYMSSDDRNQYSMVEALGEDNDENDFNSENRDKILTDQNH